MLPHLNYRKFLPEHLIACFEQIKAIIHVIRSETFIYRYRISSIEVKNFENNLLALINYQVSGSRVAFQEEAIQLNTRNIFKHFKPEHAQMIVSMAAKESMLPRANDSLKDDYIAYLRECNVYIQNERPLSIEMS